MGNSVLRSRGSRESAVSSTGELRLERREFKYLLPTELVPRIRAAARVACQPDRYARANGTYRIRSLYFDTPRFDLFRANEREAPDRFKARARCYPEAASPVFLEIKRRALDTIIKTRAPVPADRWQSLVDGRDVLNPASARWRDLHAAERFLTLVHTYHLQPVLLVEYIREAYVSDIDDYARLTFDTQIRAQRHDRLDLHADEFGWEQVTRPGRTSMEKAYVLLELKFGKTIPPWMLSIVQRFDLLRFSFSKYGYGLVSQAVVPGVRIPAFGLD